MKNGRVLRGLNVVEEALRMEDFPMTTDAVNYAVGDVEIDDGKGHFVPVRDLLDKVDKNSFENADEVVQALKQAA